MIKKECSRVSCCETFIGKGFTHEWFPNERFCSEDCVAKAVEEIEEDDYDDSLSTFSLDRESGY